MSRNPDNMKTRTKPRARARARRNQNRKRQAGLRGIQLPGMPLGAGDHVSTSQPTIVSRGGITRVTHTEYVLAVSNSTAFSATQVRINPGLAILPWLSPQAKGYEKYRWVLLEANYKPSGAVYTTAGSVYIVADYDPNDSTPSSLSDALTYETRVSGKVSLPQKLRINCARMHDGVQAKKVRCGPVAGDLSLYDGCSISVATVDGADTNGIGYIEVKYIVDLISPQTTPSTPTPTTASIYKQTGSQAFTTATPDIITWGTTLLDGLDLTYAAGVITLPCGAFKISGEASFSDTTGETLTVVVNHHKNSAAMSPVQADFIKIAVPAGGYVSIPFTAYITSDGSDTYSLSATLTGAAGTLTGQAYGTLCIEVL